MVVSSGVTWILISLGLLLLIAAIILIVRCLKKGRDCPSRCRIDDKTVLITAADTAIGVELVRELCRRGAKVIMACKNVQLGQDVAVEIRGETNCEVIVEFCDPTSLKSIHEFCTRILEQESRINILVNNASIKWAPLERTTEGFEMHWAVNHLGCFVMTQLLMPLLHRGTPDARIIVTSDASYKDGEIDWEDPNFCSRKYSSLTAYNQSRLANLLYTKELAKRLEGTGIKTYCVNPGLVSLGLGRHVSRGLGLFRFVSFLFCWLPWLKTSEKGSQTHLYCATDSEIANQSGFYYEECEIRATLTGENSSEAHRLWEMSERQVGLSS